MINIPINGYIIKHLIGSGGMADVYYAENRLGRKAAIKVLKEELCAIGAIKERFEQEARIMVEIEHKNIRQAYDIGEVNSQPAIIIEYLEGHTLKQLIDKDKISDEKAKKYFEQCVKALKVTHAKEIVHRDIKPSNIFITNNDEVKILDFGIAKIKESGLGTLTNQMLGTPVYMSPEQIKSPKNVDTKSDVYSLAVTFYHALTGKVPYDSTTDSDFEIQSKIVHEDLDLGTVSSSWSAILGPMLIKDASQRVVINKVGEINDNTKYDTVPQKTRTQSSPKPKKQQRIYYYFIIGIIFSSFIVFSLWKGVFSPFEYLSNKYKYYILVHRVVKEIDSNMIYIKGSEYLMGCVPDEYNECWENSANRVTVENFFINKYEVTQKQWTSIMNTNPSHFSNCDQCPVENVSWNDAQKFISKINSISGKTYRLPTQEEWEYAGRAKTNYKFAGSNDLQRVGWYNKNSNGKTHPVGEKEPNNFNLHDFSGNVMEWTNSKETVNYIFRGGSYSDFPMHSYIYDRYHDSQNAKGKSVGFRLAQ